jgi:hypothetical protein
MRNGFTYILLIVIHYDNFNMLYTFTIELVQYIYFVHINEVECREDYYESVCLFRWPVPFHRL